MDKRFFDTNVLLDVLERRDPWFPEAVECLGLARAGRCVGAVCAIALSDIAYIQRATDTAKIYAAFEQLVGFLDIATLGAGQGDERAARVDRRAIEPEVRGQREPAGPAVPARAGEAATEGSEAMEIVTKCRVIMTR